jgi:hypothetical protein
MNVNSSRQPGHVQFVCSVNDDDYQEILSYNELMDYIEKDEQQLNTRVLDTILVEWENGEIMSEPLNIFGKDDPVTCTVYARKRGLLEEEGWK